jgi:hypothetical protein
VSFANNLVEGTETSLLIFVCAVGKLKNTDVLHDSIPVTRIFILGF